MAKYEKFVLEALPRNAVVNSSTYNKEVEVDDIIVSVVADHISKIVDIDASDSVLSEQITSAEVLNPNLLSPETIEKIKQEAYALGAEEARAKYETIIEELKNKKNLSDLLHEKLSSIQLVADLDSQIAKVSAESIATIAKKLHLILPVNFEEIISQGLLEKLKKFYKEGKVTLTIHPDRYDFCTESLRSDSIQGKLKDNFQIIKDTSVGIDDCKLEWADTCLEYNQAQLVSEIDKIIEQLGTAK